MRLGSGQSRCKTSSSSLGCPALHLWTPAPEYVSLEFRPCNEYDGVDMAEDGPPRFESTVNFVMEPYFRRAVCVSDGSVDDRCGFAVAWQPVFPDEPKRGALFFN